MPLVGTYFVDIDIYDIWSECWQAKFSFELYIWMLDM